MLIKSPPRWLITDRDATNETHYLSRRALIAGMGLAGIAACSPGPSGASNTAQDDGAAPDLSLYPAAPNAAYAAEGTITPEDLATKYNNFYEFGSHKEIWPAAQKLDLRPWTITIDGAVEKKRVIDIDSLLKTMRLEERVYRHRCVERWAMIVPWTGFPLKALVEMARPLGSANYLQMQTFQDKAVAPGQREPWYPWPYTEALTMAEATSDLALLVTGAYGKPLPAQNGAPLRLHVPWKYGFKSAKSLVRFTFTEQRPKSFWEQVGPGEYGFWANVNPLVPHARWSQAQERLLGTEDYIPTRLFNGYAEEVAALYKGLDNEPLYR